MAKRQHGLLGLQHEFCGPWEALSQRGAQVIPEAFDLTRVFLGKHASQGSRDHPLISLGLPLLQVAGKVHSAALSGSAL